MSGGEAGWAPSSALPWREGHASLRGTGALRVVAESGGCCAVRGDFGDNAVLGRHIGLRWNDGWLAGTTRAEVEGSPELQNHENRCFAGMGDL